MAVDKYYVRYRDAIRRLSDRITALEGSPTNSGGTYWTGKPSYVLVSGLTFDSVWPDYYIDSVLYLAGSQQVTHDASDPSNPRLDVVVANTLGGLEVLKGDASSDPVKPTVDPQTQLELTTVLIGAGVTTPADVNREYIYDNGYEDWVEDTNLTNIDFFSTSSPWGPPYCILQSGFSVLDAGYFRFTYPTFLSQENYDALVFRVWINAQFANTTGWTIQFFYGSAPVCSAIDVTHNIYNFDRTIVGSWQLVVVPIADFNFTSSIFNKVRFKLKGSNSSGFKMDNIFLQGGVVVNDQLQDALISIITDSGTAIADQPGDTFQMIGANGLVVSALNKVITVSGVEFIDSEDIDFEVYDNQVRAWVKGGGSGTPGGTNGQIQYNNAGAFGGKDFIDDDTMATATSSNIASAESIKAYVDANAGGGGGGAGDKLYLFNYY